MRITLRANHVPAFCSWPSPEAESERQLARRARRQQHSASELVRACQAARSAVLRHR